MPVQLSQALSSPIFLTLIKWRRITDMKKPTLQIQEQQPKNIQRADIAPVNGFALVVDGHFKTEFGSESELNAPLDLVDVIAQQEAVLVIGEPGSGKSFAAADLAIIREYLAATYLSSFDGSSAERWLHKWRAPRWRETILMVLPLWLRRSEIAKRVLPRLRSIASSTYDGAQESYWSQMLNRAPKKYNSEHF
jgi:hypothetical protein